MIFRFKAIPGFDFLTQFAQHLDCPVEKDRMDIPKRLGAGYIRRFVFDPGFKITLHHYTLKEDLTIKRESSGGDNEVITIFFYNHEQPLGIAFDTEPDVQFSSEVQVTSNDLSSIISFPANREINYVVLALLPGRLKELLHLDDPNTTIQAITGAYNSFLFHENMSAEIRMLLKNIAAVNMDDGLGHFFMQIKVQELLYLLFHKLAQRESTVLQHINNADAERLLQIRNQVLSDLSVKPVLSELSVLAAMSETKLKHLFKQTFGDTVYNYYQQARMGEAAFLLKQGKHSVAEVGYELGFSNLSHFSRLFERHYGLNPKKFSSVG